MEPNDSDQIVRSWRALHSQERFRPVYPSEAVVRFVGRRFGGVAGAPLRAFRLLDVGCGAGRHTLAMARAGHRVSAVDISSEGVEVTRQRLLEAGVEAELGVASMTELPFEADCFDGVVAFGVYYYGDADAFDAALREAHRVLVPGGHLLVVTRSTRDGRYQLGRDDGRGTVRLSSDETNEGGMLMHFLDEEQAASVFSMFAEVTVEREDRTERGGRFLNADLVIEATKS